MESYADGDNSNNNNSSDMHDASGSDSFRSQGRRGSVSLEEQYARDSDEQESRPPLGNKRPSRLSFGAAKQVRHCEDEAT